MANVIARINKPTLVMAPNKTLAAQLYNEFHDLFPDNAVRYFVSYYDYYQPEAYVPSTDTYIEKDASINDEIDKLRHSATKALLERSDTLIVASVSCIYGLGSPEAYFDMMVYLEEGNRMQRDQMLRKLVDIPTSAVISIFIVAPFESGEISLKSFRPMRIRRPSGLNFSMNRLKRFMKSIPSGEKFNGWSIKPVSILPAIT